MPSLVAAAAVFVLLHLLVSGTRARDALAGRIGEGPYMGLFSLASVGGLAWLGFAYAGARHGAPTRPIGTSPRSPARCRSFCNSSPCCSSCRA